MDSKRDRDFVKQVGRARVHLYGQVLGERQVAEAARIARLGVAESLIQFRALAVEGPILKVAATEDDV